jgi:hypothetical protein
MNVSNYLAIFAAIILAIILFLPVAAFGREKNEGNLRLPDPVEIGSTRLQPGTYKVEWSGSGPAVHVSILQGKKTVATTSGKILELQRPSSYDDVVLKPVPSRNLESIDEIDFSNRREALRLTPTLVSHK